SLGALREYVATPLDRRRPDLVGVQHLLDPGGGGLLLREAANHGVGVGVLPRDPVPGRRRLLILEPAIGVGDRNSMQRLDYRLRLRRRDGRFGTALGRLGGGGARDENGDSNDGLDLPDHAGFLLRERNCTLGMNSPPRPVTSPR